MKLGHEYFDHPKFREYGSPIDLEDFMGENKAFLITTASEIKSVFEVACEVKGENPPYFSFTDSTQPRAFAGVIREHRIIGITIAKAILLLRYFQSAMTRPHHLYTEFLGNFEGSPTIGDPLNIHLYEPNHVPSDEKLLGIAEGLARLALIYIAGHELGHLNLGHILAQLQESVANWDEELAAEGTDLQRDKIAMEVGADRYASNILFNYIRFLENTVSKTFILQTACIAISTMFHLQRRQGKWVADFFEHTHPPAQFRGVTAVVGLCMEFLEHGPIPKDKVVNAMSQAMKVALQMYVAVTGLQLERDEGIEYARFFPKVKDHIQLILDRHRELFPNANI